MKESNTRRIDQQHTLHTQQTVDIQATPTDIVFLISYSQTQQYWRKHTLSHTIL